MSSSPPPPASASAASDSDSNAAPVINDPEVQKLLQQHTFLEPVTTSGGHVRVRCELTQHELLPRAAAIEQHMRSKKFIKAKEWYCHDYSQYAPYIVAHRRKPKSLFCNVTGTVLNRIPAEVERHVAGKKFQRLKAHVKITAVADPSEGGEGTENDAENDFDANAFEFENAQVLLSDDEDDEQGGGSGGRKSKAKAKNQSDDEDDDEDVDDDEEDEEDSEAEEKDDDDDDSDMAEFYPDEDEDADDGRLDHETVVKLVAQKKRKAPESESANAEAATGATEKHQEASQPPAKKPKAAPRPVSKARMSSKDRRQQKKAAYKKK